MIKRDEHPLGAYAGYNPSFVNGVREKRRKKREAQAAKHAVNATPLQLFHANLDTVDIAYALRITEAEVEHRLHIERSHALRKQARFVPYGSLS